MFWYYNHSRAPSKIKAGRSTLFTQWTNAIR